MPSPSSTSCTKLIEITYQRGSKTAYGHDAYGDVNRIAPPVALGATDLPYHPTLARIETVNDQDVDGVRSSDRPLETPHAPVPTPQVHAKLSPARSSASAARCRHPAGV